MTTEELNDLIAALRRGAELQDALRRPHTCGIGRPGGIVTGHRCRLCKALREVDFFSLPLRASADVMERMRDALDKIERRTDGVTHGDANFNSLIQGINRNARAAIGERDDAR